MDSVMTISGHGKAGGLRQKISRTRRRALTLIEGAMVLGLFAFVIGAAMYYYGQSNTNRQVTNGLGELASIQQAVRSLYGGQADFTGITNNALTDTAALPKKMILGTGSIKNSFGGAVTVASANAGGGNNSGFSVKFANVPQEACSKMISQDLGRGLYSVGTGSKTKTITDTSNPPPFNPTEAADACDSSANTVTWIFM